MSIATLTATGGTGSYTWTKIGGDDAAKFTLTTGGVLGFVSPLDFEHPTDADGDNIYLVQVQCSDGVNTPATQIIAVQITDVVEPIVITSPATFNAAENQTAVATLTASGGNSGPYTWTKTGGADAAKFTLTTGGVLTFTSAPNFEAPGDADANNVYVVSVQAADGVNTPVTQTISVTVTDVLELPLAITSPATFNAAENQTGVATLTASGGTNGPYTWTKTGGADTAKFTLTTGGVLTFTTAPDFEAPTDADANNIYVLQVQVADGVNTPVAQTISVTVTNVVETAAAQQQALSSSRAGVGSRIITEDHTGKTRII